MATLISAFQISKAFASKNLFESISFAIDTEQKIGLVGPNGAGKSTLLKILSGSMKPDSGQLSFSNSLRLGYLEQKPQLTPGKSIYETLVEVTDDPYDGINIALAFELITKLSLDEMAEGEQTDVGTLSGGWQKRVALARELMKRPTLLMLDEPTNHLDIQSILWLEDFIANEHQISFFIVTHDRAFLQNTCNAIFDLDPRNPDGIIKSFGDYGKYLETKQMILDSQRRLEEKRRNTMLIEKAWLARGPQARLTKQKARQNRAHEIIDEVKNLESKNQLRKSEFDFSTTGNSPKRLIELTKVSKSFTGRNLFSDLTGLIRPKARIGLLGTNGCGKSTLIKLMLGKELATSGEVFTNPDIQINYFEQGKEMLNQNTTVLKVICPEGDYVHLQGSPVFARSYLSRFHFNNFQMDMPVSKLSGGEQSRLLLAKLMLTSAHVLILDEPTNDLDVETLDVLSECLADFPGALILVSHDRFFLDQNTSELWAFTENEKGEIIKFADYYQWEMWYRSEGEENRRAGKAATAAALAQAQAAPAKTSTSSNKKLSYKETQEYENIEKNLAVKEADLAKVQAELSQPENQANYNKLQELTTRSAALEAEVATMYERWQILESKLKG